jgi:hypothetical protein
MSRKVREFIGFVQHVIAADGRNAGAFPAAAEFQRSTSRRRSESYEA